MRKHVGAEPMEEFQRNCRGCRFALARLVGTGRACCTYPGRIEVARDGTLCLTRQTQAERDVERQKQARAALAGPAPKPATAG